MLKLPDLKKRLDYFYFSKDILLLRYFSPVKGSKEADLRTATEILQHLNSRASLSLSQNHANQIGKALSKNGFEKEKVMECLNGL